uniref:Uncharacterized protein n=1 Tax=Aegilops tauschii subsp. strangulata TaxID=200361 RepID=A0A453NST1_AEGTS
MEPQEGRKGIPSLLSSQGECIATNITQVPTFFVYSHYSFTVKSLLSLICKFILCLPAHWLDTTDRTEKHR